MDNKKLRGKSDAPMASGNEEYELRYISEKTGASIDEVRRTIRQAGTNKHKVHAYLCSRNKR